MGFVDPKVAAHHVNADETEAESPLFKLYLGAAEDAATEFMDRKVYSTTAEMTSAVLAGTAGLDPMLATDAMRAAVLLTFGHLYANREDVVTGTIAVALPRGSVSLLQPYRRGMGV